MCLSGDGPLGGGEGLFVDDNKHLLVDPFGTQESTQPPRDWTPIVCFVCVHTSLQIVHPEQQCTLAGLRFKVENVRLITFYRAKKALWAKSEL